MKLIELANPFAYDNIKFMKNLIKLLFILIGTSLIVVIINNYTLNLGKDFVMLNFGAVMIILGLYLGMCIQFSRQSKDSTKSES